MLNYSWMDSIESNLEALDELTAEMSAAFDSSKELARALEAERKTAEAVNDLYDAAASFLEDTSNPIALDVLRDVVRDLRAVFA